MHELQRMQYLEAMGIDSFVPRLLLPHGKASQVCVLPQVEVTEPDEANDNRVESERPHLEAPVEKHFREAGEVVSDLLHGQSHAFKAPEKTSLSETGAPEAPEVSPATPEQTQAKAEFSLSLWRVADAIQVVDSRRLGEALPTHKLMQNIAIGMRFQQTPLAAAEILNWPLVGGHDASWTAAGQMVQGFLEGKLAQQPVRYLWLMGYEASRAILGEELDYHARLYQAPVYLEQFDTHALVLPSLAEILYEPMLKKPVWQALLNHVRLER